MICIQNRNFPDDRGTVSAPHHTALLVGKRKEMVLAVETGSEGRWRLVFSEYAEIDITDASPGSRNWNRYLPSSAPSRR